MDAKAENFVVQSTAYGRPAVDLLAEQVQTAKGGDPLAPVTVIVPSNYAAVSTRRALAGRPGGVANVTFLTLFRLAERLGAASLAAAGRRPVSTPVLAQAVRAVLAADPGVFAPVADHPATELALVASTRELAGLTDAALDAVAACSARAADVVRVARQVRTDLASVLVRRARPGAGGHRGRPEGATAGPVVVHLLQDLSPAGAELLRTLARHQPVLVNVGRHRRRRRRSTRAGRPRPGRHHRRQQRQSNRPSASAIVSVSDPDEEVRTAVRQVTDWMRDGVRLGRMALLYGTPDPYARLLHEQLDAAGITAQRSAGPGHRGHALRAHRAVIAGPARSGLPPLRCPGGRDRCAGATR